MAMEYLAERIYYALRETNDTTSLEVLLKSGLNPDNVFLGARYPEANGKTLLQICCSANDYAKIELLVKYGCHVNYGMKEVISPSERRLSFEINKNVDDLTHTCLYYAICNGNEKLVRLLVEAGADVSIKCKDNMTALMHAVDSNSLAIAKAITECKKCDINAQDIYGLSALHIAVIHESAQLVDYLLKRRARVDVEQCQGGTPLFMASDRRTLGLLLRYGSNPNHRAENGATPLSCMVKRTKVDVGCVVDLLDAGSEVPKSLLDEVETRPPTLLANNPDVMDLIRLKAGRPISLKLLTTFAIRRSLLNASGGVGLGVYKRAEILPLPRILRLYVKNLGLDDLGASDRS